MGTRTGSAGVQSLGDLAELPGVREALQWFTREKQWINEQHLELCRIPAPTFLEHERAVWFAAQFRALGCEVQLDRAGNVIAYVDPHAKGPYVAITAHLDTVLAPRSRDEVSISREGRFLGPGVSDNGAGLAGLLAIARAIRMSTPMQDLCHSLVLIANVGEEGEGNLSGMRQLCRPGGLAKKIGAFLVLDGANTSYITTEALGSRRFEVTFTGPGGHSWSDFGTGNPVHALSRAVSYFSDVKLNGSPRSSVNIGWIEGGTSINAIPALARAKVDIRSESNEKMDELVAFLNEVVERAQDLENSRATGGRVSVKVKEIGSRPAGKLAPDAAILRYLRAVDAHLGIRATVDCASTDANVPLSLGIPALSIGAGGTGGGAHTAQEWYSPEGRDLALKRVLLTAVLLLRDPALAPH